MGRCAGEATAGGASKPEKEGALVFQPRRATLKLSVAALDSPNHLSCTPAEAQEKRDPCTLPKRRVARGCQQLDSVCGAARSFIKLRSLSSCGEVSSASLPTYAHIKSEATPLESMPVRPCLFAGRSSDGYVRSAGVMQLGTRTALSLPQQRPWVTRTTANVGLRSAAAHGTAEWTATDTADSQAAIRVEDVWNGDVSAEQQRQRQASGSEASSSDSSGLCKHEADIVFYPTRQTRASLKKYENARIAHRHSVMSATDWQTIAEIFDRSYGYNLFATSSALMLHRLARMRAQNLKRKRRKLTPVEELHAPKKVVQKMLDVCLSQAKAFAARDILAVLYGVEGLNVVLSPEQLQILDDRAAVLLPVFHQRELPSFLDLRAAHKQAISPALSQALRQQWLGSSSAPSMPLGQAAKALPLLLPDVMDSQALAQICSKVEADAPSMTPPELLRLLVSLVSLSKQGAHLPMQTVDALADAVGKWAGQWSLSDASTALSCVLQLAVSSDRGQHRDVVRAERKATARTAAMSSAVVEAVGAGIAQTNRKAGSTATLGGKRRPLSLTNVINVAYQLGMMTAPECASTLLITLQSSTLVDLSVLDVADLMQVMAEWGLAKEHVPLVEALSLVVLRNKRRASARTRACVQHSLSLLQQDLVQPGPRMQSLLKELDRSISEAVKTIS